MPAIPSRISLLLLFSAAIGLACSTQVSGRANDEETGSGGTDGDPLGGSSNSVGGNDSSDSGGARGTNPESTGGAGSGGDGSGGGSTSSWGCGNSSIPTDGTFTIQVDALTRSYILDMPDTYDVNEPHRLVFAWHWLNASASDVVSGLFGSYYGLDEYAPAKTIFVAPEGIDKNWNNPDDRDLDFARALVEHLEAELCIDESQVFSVGFNAGAMLSHAIACGLADEFRAVAAISGSLNAGCQTGEIPIGVWAAHGTNDGVVLPVEGEAARDEFLERNGCGNTTAPSGPSECLSYQGCADEGPVHWCPWTGGHGVPSFAAAGISDFFDSF